MLRPLAGVCNVAEKQRRNNAQTNTEILHGEGKNKRVGFGAEISSPADQENCKSISSDVRNERNQPRIQNQISIQTVKGSSY